MAIGASSSVYSEGTMPGLMRRALDAMDPDTYGMEALAVACSLCSGIDLLEHIDPTITLEIRPANGEAVQPSRYQLAVRNNEESNKLLKPCSASRFRFESVALSYW